MANMPSECLISDHLSRIKQILVTWMGAASQLWKYVQGQKACNFNPDAMESLWIPKNLGEEIADLARLLHNSQPVLTSSEQFQHIHIQFRNLLTIGVRCKNGHDAKPRGDAFQAVRNINGKEDAKLVDYELQGSPTHPSSRRACGRECVGKGKVFEAMIGLVAALKQVRDLHSH